MQHIKTAGTLLIVLLILAGCATSIFVKVLKPAEVNMSGARKLAVFSVSVPESGAHSIDDIWRDSLLKAKKSKFSMSFEAPELTEYATDNLLAQLANTDYFEIISPTDVERALEYYDASTIDPLMLGQLLGAEAIILSEISDLSKKKDLYYVTETRVNEKTEEEYEIDVPWIRITVSLRFTYWVISTVTDKLIATKSFYKTNKHEVKEENADNLKSPMQLYREILNGNLKTVAQHLAPYEVWEARVMMKDKTKDPRMKDADNLVKGNIYKKALDLFLEIWYDNQNPAAGVNAAIMYEVLGNIDSALQLIEEVLEVSADTKVMVEYRRLQRVKEDLLRLEEQMGDT